MGEPLLSDEYMNFVKYLARATTDQVRNYLQPMIHGEVLNIGSEMKRVLQESQEYRENRRSQGGLAVSRQLNIQIVNLLRATYKIDQYLSPEYYIQGNGRIQFDRERRKIKINF